MNKENEINEIELKIRKLIIKRRNARKLNDKDGFINAEDELLELEARVNELKK